MQGGHIGIYCTYGNRQRLFFSERLFQGFLSTMQTMSAQFKFISHRIPFCQKLERAMKSHKFLPNIVLQFWLSTLTWHLRHGLLVRNGWNTIVCFKSCFIKKIGFLPTAVLPERIGTTDYISESIVRYWYFHCWVERIPSLRDILIKSLNATRESVCHILGFVLV